MAGYDDKGQPAETEEWVSEDETCCVCGRPAPDVYDGRDDCPSCGRLECEWRMRQMIDYHEDRGV